MLFKDELIRMEKPAMYDGPGTVYIDKVTDDCPPNSRLVAEIVLNPGCGIGVHTHENEAEIFRVLEGVITLTDDGTEYEFVPGQTHICYSGHSHGITNNTDKPAKVFAVIITDK